MYTSELPYRKEVFSIVTRHRVRTDEASGSRRDSRSKVTTRGHRFRGVGPHEPTGPATAPLEPVGSPRGAPPTRRTVGKRSGNPSPDRADLTRDPPRIPCRFRPLARLSASHSTSYARTAAAMGAASGDPPFYMFES